MKATKEEQLDSVVSKAIQKVAIKSPSDDFTNTLMHTINAADASLKATVYTPLISKRVWVILSTVFIILFGYVSVQSIGLVSVSDFIQETSSKILSWNIATWEVPSVDFSIANTSPYVYGALVLFGFLLLEIAILKRKYS